MRSQLLVVVALAACGTDASRARVCPGGAVDFAWPVATCDTIDCHGTTCEHAAPLPRQRRRVPATTGAPGCAMQCDLPGALTDCGGGTFACNRACT